MTRKRFLLGVSISVVLLISGLIWWRVWRGNQARADQRFPLQELKYCSSNPVKPCVVSFSQDSEGNMLVNFLTDGAFYPDFYLKIKSGENEHLYVCEKVNTFATSVYCTGKVLSVGQVLQFFIISLNEEVVLAQGNFPIIGMALASPQIYLSPTPSPSYPSYPSFRP